MRTNRLRRICAAGLVIAGTALAQTPDITSFEGNGQLTWTNSDTNLFYRVEWSSALKAPDAWHSNYCALTDIRSSDSIVTSSVPMFYRVCGSSNRLVFPVPVPKTGQTTSYAAGDDGDLEKGVVPPPQRFTDNGDGTVTDNLTGLIWLKNANFKAGKRTWAQALADCATLNNGEGGLSDGSVEGDWRLPNAKELYSLIDLGRFNPALPSGHPFTGVQSDRYWSSSTVADYTVYAWVVYLGSGYVVSDDRTFTRYVWPVRGGQ
jgi:hypothetical protein